MKVFLLKDVATLGVEHEVVTVSDGYAYNFLFPKKLAIEITDSNEEGIKKRSIVLEKRAEVTLAKTSALSERIKALKLVIKNKAYDLDPTTAKAKLYGSIGASDVAEALVRHGIQVSKNQIDMVKAIKMTGLYTITVKLSNQLKPQFTLKIVPE